MGTRRHDASDPVDALVTLRDRHRSLRIGRTKQVVIMVFKTVADFGRTPAFAESGDSKKVRTPTRMARYLRRKQRETGGHEGATHF